MDVNKIKPGKTVTYDSRTIEGGKAKVIRVYEGKTGHWVSLHDKVRAVEVTVRPSQVR